MAESVNVEKPKESKWKNKTAAGYNYNIVFNNKTEDNPDGIMDYDIDMSDWDSSHSDDWSKYGTGDSKKGNHKYYWYSQNGKRWIDSFDDAPKGATIYKDGIGSDGSLMEEKRKAGSGTGNSKSNEKKLLRTKEYTKRRSEVEKHYTKTQEEEKKRREQKELAAKKAKEMQTREKEKRIELLNKMPLSEYATDATFNIGEASAAQLIEKAKNEDLSYDEILDLVKGTQWENNKFFLEELEKNFDEDDKNEELRKIYNEYKLDPDENKNYTDFKSSYLSEEKSEKIKNAINRLDEKDQERLRQEIELNEQLQRERDKAVNESEKRDAEKELEEQAREFEAKYPSLAAQLFNPGLTAGQKALRLSDMVLNLGANIVNGTLSGFKGSPAKPISSKWSSYYNDIVSANNKRNSAILDKKAESDADKITRERILDNSPYLKALNNEARQRVQALLGGAVVSRLEFRKAIGNYQSGEEAETLYQDYLRARGQYEEGQKRYSSELANKQSESTLKFYELENMIKSNETATNYVSSLNKELRELKSLKLEIQQNKEDSYWKAAQYVMNFVGGIEMASNNSQSSSVSEKHNNNTSGWSFNANLGYAGNGVSGGYQNMNNSGWSTTNTSGGMNSKQIEVMKKLNIPVAEKNGKQFIENTEPNRQALIKAIDDQIALIENDLLPQAKELQSIVKDRTANENTSSDINLKALSEESKERLLQKKLGYCGNTINKDFNYYLTKLRGGADVTI